MGKVYVDLTVKNSPFGSLVLGNRVRGPLREGIPAVLISGYTDHYFALYNLDKLWNIYFELRDNGFGAQPVIFGNSETDECIRGLFVILHNDEALDSALEITTEYQIKDIYFCRNNIWFDYEIESRKTIGEGKKYPNVYYDRTLARYISQRGFPFELQNKDGTGAIGYLDKNIHFPVKGPVFIPGNPLPRELQSGFRNYCSSTMYGDVTLPKKYVENWTLNNNGENISMLDLKHKYASGDFTKFAYHPKEREYLPVYPGEHHKYGILNSGKYPVDEYVRGIILRDYPNIKRCVAFRPCFPVKELERINKEISDKKERLIQIKLLSFDLQFVAMEALMFQGNTDWNFQFNVTNELLEEQTGVSRLEW